MKEQQHGYIPNLHENRLGIKVSDNLNPIISTFDACSHAVICAIDGDAA